MSTALTLNGCMTASSTLSTANQLVANQTGTTTATNNTKIGTATGYGEIYAQGNTGAWPALGAIGSPSGNGWLFDVTTLEGQTIIAGNWQWVEKFRVTNVSIVADITVRAYKRSSGGVYTAIGSVTLAAQTVGTSSTVFTSALTSLPSMSFATGDKLYLDMWLHITTNNTGSTSATFNVIECNNASAGVANIAQMLTPGYQTTSITPILATSPTSLSFSAMAGGSNPPSQNDTLSETAGAGTAWTSAISYGSGSGWLAISPTSGTLAANGTQIVAFTCTTGALAAGTYTATVTYTATTGGATATVGVTFVVTAAPALSAAPASLSFSATVTGVNPPSQTDTLTNTGGTSSAWTSAISYGSGSGWLAMTPTSGTLAAGAHTSVTYTCTTGSLAVGTYTATVTYTATTGGATATVNVTFVVNAWHLVTIGGSPVAIDEGTFQLSKKLDERWRCQFTVLDYAGTLQLSYRQQVTVSDPQLGLLFTGFVADVKQDKTNTYPDPTIELQVDCIDNRGLVDKRTSNYLYANQQAGVIAAHQVQTYLAAEGVTMQAALGWFESLASWQSGTTSGTVATTNASDSNAGDGDLELALAGTAVTLTEQTTSDWNTNLSLSGLDTTNNMLTLASHATLEFSGLNGGNYGGSFGNAFAYQQFWNGSYTIASGDQLQYSVWVNSSSPQIMAGVDIIFTNGSDVRDSAVVDQNGLSAHPKTDLAGYANDQWYSRTFDMSIFAAYGLELATLGFEGDNAGQYTAYFRDIIITNGGVTKLVLYQGVTPHAALVQPTSNVRIAANGYSQVTITPVIGYESTGTRIANTTSLTAAGIYRSSLLDWVQSLPLDASGKAVGTVTISTSIDGGATYQAATNFAAVANLLPGASLSGQTLQTQIVLALTGKDPVLSPTVSGITWTVQPSYVATKSDTRKSYTSATDWNTGTLTNLMASNGDLTINSSLRNWDDASTANQTLFGGASPAMGTLKKQGTLTTASSASADASIQFNFAGQWADFEASIDIQVPINGCHLGLIYRTTGWQNNNDTYAYEVDLSVNSLSLGRGTNSGSGTGTRTNISTVSLTLNAGDWHTLTVVAVGSSHTIYIDGVQYISATDGTYTGAGYLGVRNFNASASTVTGIFDNFGVMPVAAVAPNTPLPQWVSASIALGSITVGNSIIQWNATQPNGSIINVLASVNGGAYTACTNGAVIPGLTTGTILTSGTLQLKVQMQAAQASAAPVVSGLTAWVLSAYSSSGTWVSPALSLAPVTNADTTLVNWNVNLPNTNTAATLATSIDGGATYQAVVNQGDPIANITTMPPPFEDTFTTDTHTSYTQTALTNGGPATWTWDTANTRLEATQTTGIDGILEATGIVGADMQVMGDFNYSDSGGLVARMVDASNAYMLSIADARSSANANTAKLYAVTSGGGGGGSVTPLTVYGSTVAATTLTSAGQLSIGTGGTDVIAQTKMGTATGYGEIVAFGTSAAWAALGSIGSPTGKGWLLDSSLLASQQFPAGTWTATLSLRATVGAPHVDMYLRAYAYDTVALTYTAIGTLTLAGQALTATIGTYTLTGSLSVFTLNATQKLYLDVWFNVTVAASSSSCQISFHESNSATAGVANDVQLVTPGYQASGVTPLTAYLSNAQSATVAKASQLYTTAGTPTTTTRDVVVGTATGYGELTSRGTSSGGTDSPYGVVYFFSGSTPSYVPLQLLDLLVGGNRSGLGSQTGLVPGGPIWLRPQLQWKQFELTNQHTSTPTYDATALAVADDLVSRCNGANILIDFCIQAPPQWRRTIDINGNTVPYDGQTYIGTLNQTITAGIQYSTIEVSTLKTGDTLSDQQQMGIDYNGTTEYVVVQGNYSAGAHTITVLNTAGKTFKAAQNHASGCVVENTGGQFASPADMDYYVKFFAARYNGTTTNVLTGLSQTALTIQAMQVNEDYDTPGNNLQRDYQSKWFVTNWQLCGPHLRTIHPTCKLIGPAVRRTGKSSIDPTYGLSHITTWTDYLFSYTPPGSSYAGCVTDGSGNLLLDGLDFHYYRDNVLDNSGSPSPDPSVPLPGPTDGSYVPTQAQELLAIKAVAAKYVSRNAALANFDVWCTETGWDVFDDGTGTVNFVTQQQQADFICGPNNTGNLTGNPGVYDQHRQNGGSHVFIWTMNPLTSAKMYLTPPTAVTTKNIVQNEIASLGGTPVFTLLTAYTAMQAYIAAHPSWNSSAWPARTTIGLPTGAGWMLDATTLEGQNVLAGNWSALVKLGAFQSGVQAGSLGLDLYVRAFRYSSLGIYTQLVSMVLSGQTVSASADFALPSTAGANATFATGDKLYVDLWANVTSNSNGSSVQALRLQSLSTDTSGHTGASDAAVVSPGYQRSSGSRQTTLLATASINFVRGMYHRFILDVEGSTITASMDGAQLFQVIDTAVSGIGGGGLLAGVTMGHALQCVGLRVAPYGQNVSTLSVLTKVTLTSTDPTQTPQMLDLQTFVSNPSIGAGTLMANTNYQYTFIDKNLDDLAKQSNYGWYLSQARQLVFQDRQTSPAPWILSSNTLGLLSELEVDGNLLVENAGDLYRNRQVIKNVIGTASFTDTFVGDGKSTSFTLRYPVAIGTIPVITLDNQPQTIGQAGGPTMQWYYTEGSNTIAQDSSGTVLSGLDTLIVSYTGTFPDNVVLDNTAAQAALAAVEGGSGIVEAVEDVSSQQMTYAQGVIYATQLLTRYCTTGRTLTCTILRNGLEVGQIWSIFVPEEHLQNVQLLIRQIDITLKTQPGNTVLYTYSVTATELPNPGSWQKLIASGLLQ